MAYKCRARGGPFHGKRWTMSEQPVEGVTAHHLFKSEGMSSWSLDHVYTGMRRHGAHIFEEKPADPQIGFGSESGW